MYALSSAALVQNIAKTCSQGLTTQCGCAPHPNEDPPEADFSWGGCGDNVGYGSLVAELFADADSKKKQNAKLSLVNRHNNAAGRTVSPLTSSQPPTRTCIALHNHVSLQIASSSLQTSCKCHGVSGSCTTKTCWKQVANLRVVGAKIRDFYTIAREVKTRRRARSRESNNERRDGKAVERQLRALHGRTRLRDDELVYFTSSPDYCLPDSTSGSLGTVGRFDTSTLSLSHFPAVTHKYVCFHFRECKKNEPGSMGCQSMCCGRGFTSQIVTQQYRCDCKYYWCCYVKCKTCTKQVEINRCR